MLNSTGQLKSTQAPLSFNIIQTIIDHFPMNCYDQNILCYTELKINETIYCADNNYRQGSSWYDNVIVAWNNGDDENIEHGAIQEDIIALVPAQLLLFFRFESDSTLYALVHSCHYRYKKICFILLMDEGIQRDKDIQFFKLQYWLQYSE